MISHDTLYFNDDNYNFSFFISDFIVLSPLVFFLDSLAEDLTVLLIFSKKPLIPSLISLIIFLKIWCLFIEVQLIYSVLLYSFYSLYFISFFWDLYDFVPFTNFGFCLFFSSSFRYKIRLFISDFSYFLR